MDFPINLKSSIDEYALKIKQSQLKQTAETISDRYRTQSGTSKKLLTETSEVAAYSVVRMPATFGSVSDALSYALESYYEPLESLLDIGAGTGAASWAADSILNLKSVTCLEREPAMIQLGQRLMQEGSQLLQSSTWIQTDLIKDPISYQGDLVISSYVLNELSPTDRIQVVEKLWNATNKMLIIIEPGTPIGFQQLLVTRDFLLEKGAYLAAPCPHSNTCRLETDDWCHFTTRIQRSKLHKILKQGDSPYEDEKFSYMAFTKSTVTPVASRILRHPYIEKGQITLHLCSSKKNQILTIKKRDGILFKIARKSKSGDSIDIS